MLVFLGRSIVSDWSSVQEMRWRLSAGRLILSLALLGVYYPLLVWNWCALMRLLGQPVPFRSGLGIWLGSQLGKFVPGKVWTVIGRAYLAERAGLDPVRVSVSLFVEVGLNVVTGILVAAVAIPLGGGIDFPGGRPFAVLVPAGLVALHPRVFGPLVNRGLALFGREPFPFRWPLRGYLSVTSSLVVAWILYGGAFYLFMTAISVPQGPAGSWESGARYAFVIGVSAISWVIGFLAFLTPNGLGIREASLVFFLAHLMPAPVATLVAVLNRLWVTAIEVSAAGLAWAAGRRAER